MIAFYPFRASIDRSGICSEFSENNSRIQNTISYFFSNAFTKSRGVISEDIIYYLCLEHNTLLFRIDTDMKLTGMYFEENQIISSWNNITGLINYLFNITYETIMDITSVELSEGSVTYVQDSASQYITDVIEKKYRNCFIPRSFIAGKDADVFFVDDTEDIDYPVSNEISHLSDMNDNNQKICIPYNEQTEPVLDSNDPVICYHTPQTKKKSLLQMFKGRKEQDSDFLNNLFIKTESGDVLLSTHIKTCMIEDEPGSFLFRLDKIAYTSGGSQ